MKVGAINIRTCLLLLIFVASCLLLGWVRAGIWQEPLLVSFDLTDGKFLIQKVGGFAWAVDIRSLRLADASDDETDPDRSRLQLLEDGTPLLPHSTDAAIVSAPGHFRHSESRLLLATTDGANPLTNGHHYQLVTNLPADIAAGVDATADLRQWKFRQSRDTAYLLAGGIFLLIAAGLLSLDRGWTNFGVRHVRLSVLLVFAGSAAGLGIDASSHWRDFTVSADTQSYEVRPGHHSYRTPGYWAFGHLVLGSQWNPLLHHEIPLEKAVPPGQSNAPLVRVARAQKLLTVASALILGGALLWTLPAPLAAAFALFAGSFCCAFPWDFDQDKAMLVGLAAILAGAMLYGARVRGRRLRWMSVPVAVTGGIAGSVVILGLLQFGFAAGMTDMLMSEGVSFPLEFLWLACILGFVCQGSRWWLPLIALSSAVIYLVRPSDGVDWLVVSGLVPLCMMRNGWRSSVWPIGLSVAIFLVGVLIPSEFLSLISDDPPVPERHSLAFATIIADEGDIELMPDAAAKAYLTEVLPRMAEARRSDPSFGEGLTSYFNAVAYNIAWPTIREVVEQTGEKDPPRAARALAARVSHLILRARYPRYFDLISHGVFDAEYYVRFTHIAPLQLIPIIVFAGFVLLRTVACGVAVLLVLGAAAFAIVPLLTSVPIGRLIAPADPMICIALLIIVGECLRYIMLVRPKSTWERLPLASQDTA